MHRRRSFAQVGRSAAAGAAALVLVGLAALATGTAAVAEVPEPGEGEAVVTVRVGGDRVGTREVAPLPGVVLGLYTEGATPEPVDQPWALCTSDADGDCSFVVPATGPGGANAGARFLVRQLSAPAGWYTNPTLRTGAGSGSGSVARPYEFLTPPLEAGQTYSSLAAEPPFMFGSAGSGRPETDSEGVWQQSRSNPEFAAQCGVDVALVLDLSASLGSQVTNLKAATDSIADALVGTPSRMAVFSFDGTSPATNGGNAPTLVPVSTQGGADAFKAQYAGWATGSGTNWDQALWAVAQAAPDYQVVVLLTDGNPTRFSADPLLGSGGTTHFRDVENGIYSADAVKARGSRLLALGVGSGIDDVTRLNLRALSGETFYEGGDPRSADYFDLADFESAGSALRDVLLSGCASRLTVTKELVPAENLGEDVTGAVPAGPGWEISAGTTTAGVTVTPPTQTTPDDGTGSVVFDVDYGGQPQTATLTVAETQQDGYDLVTAAGANAVCVDKLAQDAPVAVESSGATGFTVDLPPSGFVSCTIRNRPQSAVVVDKTWVVRGEAFAEGEQPEGLEAALTLTGPDGAGPSAQPWGAERGGYAGAQEVVVDETTTLPAGCVLTGARVTSVDGEAVDEALPFTTTAGSPTREVEVTNEVVCPPMLTLVKEVVNDDGGTAAPADWTLTASGSAETGDLVVTGASGSDDVTAVPVEEGTYALAEDGPAGYTTLGWECVDGEGAALAVEDEVVVVGPDDAVTCTVTNDDDPVPPTTPAPEPSEPGATAAPAPGGGGPLATTGASVALLTALAGLAVAVGTGTVVLVRRRRSAGVEG
ncbi:VWA domain-containing protein [Cellulosimicrobium aquatile]|uniref:VWA domain-containing protein n=1 Tax=Cellulosimicrobium aquatile TaxID=1612203 RepID=UPI001980EA65